MKRKEGKKIQDLCLTVEFGPNLSYQMSVQYCIRVDLLRK